VVTAAGSAARAVVAAALGCWAARNCAVSLCAIALRPRLILLLDRLPEAAARGWYTDKAVQHDWSRASCVKLSGRSLTRRPAVGMQLPGPSPADVRPTPVADLAAHQRRRTVPPHPSAQHQHVLLSDTQDTTRRAVTQLRPEMRAISDEPWRESWDRVALAVLPG